jgi:O-antigen/teichoic acid export membrane protein
LKLASRAAGLLPTGTLLVAAGLAVLGVGTYAQLAVAGHSLSTAGMAAMSVLWSIVFWIGVGLFFPVEQELIRLVAARTARGEGIVPVARRAAALAGAILAATLAPLAVAARPLADSLFSGDIGMVGALAAALLGLAVTSVCRGVLAGQGKFTAYGGSLAIDGGLRIALACALGIAGTRSPTAFGLTMAVPPLLSAACMLGPLLRDLHPGPAIAWTVMCRGLGLLIGTMLLAQFVVNVAVINVRLLSPGDPAVVGALLAAMILARVPLFVFTSLQVSLLPGLAGAVAAADKARFRQLAARGCGIVTVLGIAGGVPAAILGPRLIRVLFAVRPTLGHADFAWLASGTLFYMLAMVLGQSAMALSRHRDQLLGWMTGVLVLVAITLGPGEVKRRVEVGYALSSLTVAVVLALVVFLRTSRPGAHRGRRSHAATAVSGGAGQRSECHQGGNDRHEGAEVPAHLHQRRPHRERLPGPRPDQDSDFRAE